MGVYDVVGEAGEIKALCGRKMVVSQPCLEIGTELKQVLAEKFHQLVIREWRINLKRSIELRSGSLMGIVGGLVILPRMVDDEPLPGSHKWFRWVEMRELLVLG